MEKHIGEDLAEALGKAAEKEGTKKKFPFEKKDSKKKDGEKKEEKSTAEPTGKK